MCTYKRIAVTNRKLCKGRLPEQVKAIIQDIDLLILREKDLPEMEYEALAREILNICHIHNVTCILHTYTEAARRLGCTAIHLPLPLLKDLRKNPESLRGFTCIGASVHSVEEARKAVDLGADYVTAGHVFVTDCKKGLPGRGLAFLREVCEAVPVPVYGIGGITKETESQVIAAGAAGACRMSDYMSKSSTGQ